MPAAALGLMVGTSIAGTVMSTVGQVKAGNAAKAQGDYNAMLAEAQAKDAVDRGAQDESAFRMGVRQLIGSQRSGFAAQGVVVDQGSAADVQADAAFLGELDALKIRTNAQREAWGYRVDAENQRRSGESQQRASRWNAAATVATGAANAAGVLYQRYGSRSSTA